jgi:hypothetical protein
MRLIIKLFRKLLQVFIDGHWSMVNLKVFIIFIFCKKKLLFRIMSLFLKLSDFIFQFRVKSNKKQSLQTELLTRIGK